MEIQIVLQLLLALGLGGLIGMERGIKTPQRLSSKGLISFGEIRTFALISFFGALSAWISLAFQTALFIITGLLLLGVFIGIYYAYTVFKEKQYGLTSEVSALITFLLGAFVMIGSMQVAIILSIILTFVLSSKSWIDKIVEKISREELNNTLKFAVISIVMLPLLSAFDEKYSIAQILVYLGYTSEITNSILTLKFFNPYGLWFFVVLMAGISYSGYIMSKVIGEKGSIVASGAIGGLVSSTAVTAAMTESSKKDKRNTNMYVVSTLLASTIMFIRVVVIVLFFNIDMLSSIIYPSAFMLAGMVVYIGWFYLNSKKKDLHKDNLKFEEKKYKSPFSIGPALKFAGFVLMIKFIAGVGGEYKDIWGDYFFYALGVISGLADVDAVSQTMAVDSLDGKIGLEIAAITIIIAVISNNFVKGGIAWRFGEQSFGKAVMGGFIVSMICGVGGMTLMSVMG